MHTVFLLMFHGLILVKEVNKIVLPNSVHITRLYDSDHANKVQLKLMAAQLI